MPLYLPNRDRVPFGLQYVDDRRRVVPRRRVEGRFEVASVRIGKLVDELPDRATLRSLRPLRLRLSFDAPEKVAHDQSKGGVVGGFSGGEPSAVRYATTIGVAEATEPARAARQSITPVAAKDAKAPDAAAPVIAAARTFRVGFHAEAHNLSNHFMISPIGRRDSPGF